MSQSDKNSLILQDLCEINKKVLTTGTSSLTPEFQTFAPKSPIILNLDTHKIIKSTKTLDIDENTLKNKGCVSIEFENDKDLFYNDEVKKNIDK